MMIDDRFVTTSVYCQLFHSDTFTSSTATSTTANWMFFDITTVFLLLFRAWSTSGMVLAGIIRHTDACEAYRHFFYEI